MSIKKPVFLLMRIIGGTLVVSGALILYGALTGLRAASPYYFLFAISGTVLLIAGMVALVTEMTE